MATLTNNKTDFDADANPSFDVLDSTSTSGKKVQHVNIEQNFASKVDEASATVTYHGRAVIGALGSAALWQIRKTEIVGTVTSTTWADSNDNADNIWDNRASLTYG
jgi:hypothetical protein